MSGQMMTAAALLDQNLNLGADEIRQAMNNVYSRCGTYYRIREAMGQTAQG
jgi:aerobic-type carbon monoxide dehydrogenase small subunit (CoxS/CutS family)